LIPDCPLEHVSSAGNAAGTGARIALLDQKARQEIEEVVRRIHKVETALEPRFQQHFIEAMAFPHRTAGYPHLERVVTLPKRRAPQPDNPAVGGDGSMPSRPRRRARRAC
jgi:uncharacterized 2Fe-2S/4Fe-4S cluster protein (DUF4445 family)